MLSNIVKLIREDIMLINKHSTAASLWEREMKGEAVIKILIPAFVFHSIIVKFILSKGEGSQSFHRHTNVEQKDHIVSTFAYQTSYIQIII